MDKIDFQKVAKRAKDSTRGIAPQQIGDMTIQESNAGCDLIIEYTRSPRFSKGEQALSLGIHFNNATEAEFARDFLHYGEADLDAPVERKPAPGLDKSFRIDL